uniref:Uncharacterized protein n=1 Tax=Arundo donax TaxID=35708 RepID=A0A0A8Y6F9_ARUDO
MMHFILQGMKWNDLPRT